MTIPITFFRSSSLNRWTYCPALFLAEYTLGYKGESNKKADLGTLCHKIFEYMGILKKEFDAGKKYTELEICGKTKTNNYNLDKIVKDVFNHYQKVFARHNFGDEEYDLICSWVKKIQNYNNGEYNPQNLKIVATEIKFDFELCRPWAMFDYNIQGQNHNGFLRLKGSIDMVFEPTKGVYNILDLKTGARKDWAKDKEKTPDDIYNDEQLCFYFYALSNLFPDVEIWATLFYINSGGAYTVCFDKSRLPSIENHIKRRFEEIKNCKNVMFNKTWKCTRLSCDMYKKTFENTHIKPIQEFRDGQFNKRGETMCRCSQLQFMLEKKGIEKTIEEYKDPDFTLGFYFDPGGPK